SEDVTTHVVLALQHVAGGRGGVDRRLVGEQMGVAEVELGVLLRGPAQAQRQPLAGYVRYAHVTVLVAGRRFVIRHTTTQGDGLRQLVLGTDRTEGGVL